MSTKASKPVVPQPDVAEHQDEVRAALPALVPTPTAREQKKAGISFAAFLNTIERLEQTIESETRALRENKIVDLREFNHRKNHGLLELSRSLRVLISSPYEQDVKARLLDLRGKLDCNLAMLKTHLEAVHQVSSIISRAIQDEDSDGTYCARQASGDSE